MTLKYMQGFESMRDDTDFRAQGWVPGPTKMTAVFPPPLTAPGTTSMRLLATGNGSTSAPGSASVPDLGYLNTGVTVNQAWLAGGFSFGFTARFNTGVSTSYGAGFLANATFANSNSVCFDGTRYWTIQLTGSTYTVATSTDLKTWTATSSQPTGTLNSYTTLNYMGSNVVALVGVTTETTAVNVWYTSNAGVSWTSQTIVTPSSISGNSGSRGVAIATGNATYPHAVFVFLGQSSGPSAPPGGLYVGTLGGTMTSVAAIQTGIGLQGTCVPRIFGGVIMIVSSTGAQNTRFYSATASNASLNTAGAWTTATLASAYNIIPSDICYNPVSNLWVLTTGSGIWTFGNTGAAGTPVGPTGTITLTQRYSTVALQNIYWTGSQMVAAGGAGHIITSPDGITWTEGGGHLLPVGTSGYDWRCTLYDGSRYVLFSDSTTGVIATTPDLVINYQVQYAQDATEQTNTSNAYGQVGLYSGTAPNASTGLWTVNSNGMFMYTNTISSNARAVFLYYGLAAGAALGSGSIPMTNPVHYLEFVAIPTATANTFLLSMYLDGMLLMSDPNPRLQGSSTTDTTSLLIFMPSRTGSIVGYDDMYFTLNDGVAPSGVLGPVAVVMETPNTDVQDQWVKTGSAASNSLSVGTGALSSNSANYVSSTVAGDKDVYGTTSAIPEGYATRAVQVEGYFSSGAGSTVANLGIKSGSTEIDGANQTVTSTTPLYTSTIYATDPNGGVAWTNASAHAANPVINHIS